MLRFWIYLFLVIVFLFSGCEWYDHQQQESSGTKYWGEYCCAPTIHDPVMTIQTASHDSSLYYIIVIQDTVFNRNRSYLNALEYYPQDITLNYIDFRDSGGFTRLRIVVYSSDLIRVVNGFGKTITWEKRGSVKCSWELYQQLFTCWVSWQTAPGSIYQ